MAVCSGTSRQAVRDRALLLVLVDSGVRRSEVSQLDWNDVDLKARTIHIRHGKGDKPRVTTMGDACAKALWQLSRLQGGAGDAPAFRGRSGARLTPSGIYQAIASIGDRAGVEGLHPHRFRHSWAHYLKLGGCRTAT